MIQQVGIQGNPAGVLGQCQRSVIEESVRLRAAASEPPAPVAPLRGRHRGRHAFTGQQPVHRGQQLRANGDSKPSISAVVDSSAWAWP